MVFSKKSTIAILFAAVASLASAAEKDFSYVPEIHGALRTRWEINTNSGEQRFQVRNARVTLGGKIAPSLSYFFQTDLCDAGKMKILDAYAKFDVVKGLFVQAGQFRMPFGVEPFYAPANYIFANRSFMGKQVMNYRAVGGKIGYTLPKTPLTLEFGVFNPTAIGDHNVWSKTVAFSGKALYKLPKGFSISAGYASIKPADVRANLIDACLQWQNSNWLIAGEYMFKHYRQRNLDGGSGNPDDNHSYVVFVDWHKPVNCGMFNQWSIQARFDGMTDHTNMTTLALEAARKRATIGTTLTYKYKAVHADVRVNYEKYFDYKEGGYSPDRFVAELVVRF